MLRPLKEKVQSELRHDLESRRGPLVAQVYCPFLWRHWATGWYTIRAIETRTIVLTDQRRYEHEWPWPEEFLVEWSFEGRPPHKLAEVDLFHLHNGWTATSRGLQLIEAFTDKRYVASFLGTDVNKHARLGENSERYRRLFETVEAAIVPCDFLTRKLIGLGCDERKVQVIPWGVEPSILPRKDRADFSPAGTLRVCMLARMIELKGIDVAIEAVDLAAAEASITLDVVGDGPERDRLLTKASKVNSRHRAEVVRIHGDGNTMPAHVYAMEVLKNSDCLVNCSRPMPDGSEETMSIAMIEAQMVGVPVIAFWCGGAAEIVQHDETGWLAKFPEDNRSGNYEEASSEGLADALVRLSFDRDNRVRMGTTAAKQARQRFSTSMVAEAFDRLYGEVAAGGHGA
jgi:glycosyltransferase involved in cell wall biosynthesis